MMTFPENDGLTMLFDYRTDSPQVS